MIKSISFNGLLVLMILSLSIVELHAQQSPDSETERKTEISKIIEDYHGYLDDQNDTRQSAWPNYSPNVISRQKRILDGFITRLKMLKKETLFESDVINQEMLLLVLEDRKYNLDYESYLLPLTSEGGFLTSMLYSTQNLRIEDEEALANYQRKIKSTPEFIDQKIELMSRGLEENKILPKLIVEKCISILDQYLNTPVDELFINQPFKTYPSSEEKGLALVKEMVIPSFVKFKEYLEKEYLPKAKDIVGVHSNKDGKAYYEQRVRYFTTLDMTPQEVFDTGMSEVSRIKSEMEKIIADLNYEGSYADFLTFLRTDPQFYAETPQQLLSHAAWLSKKAEEILPRYFTHLPRLPFTVNPVPEAIAPNYTTGRYSGGSIDNHRSGQYWVNTHDLPSRPLFVLPALTLHEAVPGHHLQISLAKEMEDVPKFRTNTYLSAYGEGWGLYAEYLGKEAGMYTTAYEDFGRLTYEMWRACRLVVDPGMHYMGWTREQAVEFMSSNTALSFHEINTEINRYIGWPGQAVSYKIGELKIRELRKKAEQELGDQFDIRTFHDTILANGSIPLFTLERIVDKYILVNMPGN